MHFQAWKRNYYTFTVNKIGFDVTSFLVTETGFIPLPSNRQKTFESKFDLLPKDHRKYCATFSTDLKICSCSISDSNIIRIKSIKINTLLYRDGLRETQVTLILTIGSIHALSNAILLIDSWKFGPSLVVIDSYLKMSELVRNVELQKLIKTTVSIILYMSLDHCDESNAASQNLPLSYAMLNLALDQTETDFVCVISLDIWTTSYNSVLNQQIVTVMRNIEISRNNSHKVYMIDSGSETKLFGLFPIVIFNQSAFGSKFVRFPEELRTPRCDNIFTSYTLSLYDFFEYFGYVISSIKSNSSGLYDIFPMIAKDLKTSHAFNDYDFKVSFQCKTLFQQSYLKKFSNTIKR